MAHPSIEGPAEGSDFELQLSEQEAAGDRRQAYDAEIQGVRLTQGEDAALVMSDQFWHLSKVYRQATMDLALTPAWTADQVKRKRAAIGTAWLHAEGDWYDRLRAGVAADTVRVSAKRVSKRRRPV